MHIVLVKLPVAILTHQQFRVKYYYSQSSFRTPPVPSVFEDSPVYRRSHFGSRLRGAMAAADAPLQRTSVDFACGRRFASPLRREPPVPLPAVALDASALFGAPDLTTARRCERGPAAAGDILAYETELGALLLLAERSLQLIVASFRRVPSRTSGTSHFPWSIPPIAPLWIQRRFFLRLRSHERLSPGSLALPVAIAALQRHRKAVCNARAFRRCSESCHYHPWLRDWI